MQGTANQLWQFGRRTMRLVGRSLWIGTKDFTQQIIVIAGLLYFWTCFGTGHPQRYLRLHEAYAVLDQAVRNIQEKGCAQ